MGKKDAEAEQAVLDFVMKHNRPFNAQTVVDGLKGTVKKTAASKALEALAERGDLTMKEYGKQKIFFPNQDNFEVPDAEQLRELDAELKDLAAEVKQLSSEAAELDKENKDLDNELTDEQIATEVAQLEQTNAAAEEKLERLRGGAKPISAEERTRTQKAFDTAKLAWRKRKRMCMDAIGQISEGTGKKIKLLVQEMALETDEELGVDVTNGPFEQYQAAAAGDAAGA